MAGVSVCVSCCHIVACELRFCGCVGSETMEDWVLSESETSDTEQVSLSSNSDSDIPRDFLPHDDALKPLGGRQLGQIGPEARAVRDRFLQRLGFHNDDADDAPLVCPRPPQPEIVAKRPCSAESVSMLRPVGNSCYNLVVSKLQAYPVLGPPGQAAGAFLQHFFDDEARHIASRKMESTLVHMSRQTFRRRVVEAACLAHVGARMYIASIVSELLLHIARKRIRMVSLITAVAFDETPLVMKSCSSQGALRQNVEAVDFELPKHADVTCQDNILEFRKDRGTVKILQSHINITCLFEDLSTSTLHEWSFPLPCPLTILDRATGPALEAALQEHLTLPGLADMGKAAEMVHNVCIRDSAPANINADEIAFAKSRGGAFRLPTACGAHGVANAQGYSFNAVKETISGIISLSLAQKPGGSVEVLRSCVAEVLRRSAHPRAGLHLRENLALVSYRNSVFDLCLRTDTAAGMRRRASLELLLISDLQQNDIQLATVVEQGLDVRQWAEAVAENLLPSAIPLFPRPLLHQTLSKVYFFKSKWMDGKQCVTEIATSVAAPPAVLALLVIM